ETRVIARVLDDRADRPRARVGPRDHRLDLSLEVLEPVLEHLDELQVVDRVEMDDLHDVADDRVPLGEEPRRADHRARVVEHPEELVEAEGDPLLPVIVARGGLDDEADHVETAEEDLEPLRPRVDVAPLLETAEPRVDLARVEVEPERPDQADELAGDRA